MSASYPMKWNMSSKPTADRAATVWRTAITGGIGSGKSYVCRRLEAAGHPVFYCDAEAKRIIRTDTAVKQALRALVGNAVYDSGGQLVKAVLAAYICADRAQAARVDAIVHPRVADAFAAWAGAQTATRVFMECALLFESGFERLVDDVAVVVVPEALRLQRVMARDRVSAEKARAWMKLQLPETEKIARADYCLRNDSEPHLDEDLAKLLAAQSLGSLHTLRG